jgi:hemoglobin
MRSSAARIRAPVVALLLSALAASAHEPAPAPASLYDRLGGSAVLTAVVDETVDTMSSNPRVNQSFDKVDLKRLKRMVVEQLCALAGGPCRNSGDGMKIVHAGLDITQTEFYAQVETLRAALDHHGVGTRETNELLRMLAPMKRDVVTK